MQQSQLEPLPADLPFRFVSQTIGRGAFASIKKAVPLHDDQPVFAVKLIHKAYAVKHGRISPKQISTEVSLHAHIGQHPNVIEWFASGEDAVWRWIAMEYAEGGDLFDKIEADVGVPEDIAHLYFRQLVSGVRFIHSKGVAHRDLKPENILLSGSGNLKLADFGMSTMFAYKGRRKQSATTCGSPPYMAPEVLTSGRSTGGGAGASDTMRTYDPDLADIWSCGVILFVLLVGNTPWDEPVMGGWEFYAYATSKGHSSDPLWQNIPPDALSLLRGMMCIDTKQRFSFTRILQHPWYTRKNGLLTDDGRVSDPIELATQMLSNLHINLRQDPRANSRGRTFGVMSSGSDDAMDVDGTARRETDLAQTQPVVPISDAAFAWERPGLQTTSRRLVVSSTQPVRTDRMDDGAVDGAAAPSFDTLGVRARHGLREAIVDEPAMSQFSQARGVPVSLTQHARRFQDIVPAYSLTRFYSHVSVSLLVQILCAGLHELNVPVPAPEAVLAAHADNGSIGDDRVAGIRVRLMDGRKQMLHGEVLVDRAVLTVDGQQAQLLEVRFVKVRGDPLEWRRFFKKMAQLCRDGIYAPDDEDAIGF